MMTILVLKSMTVLRRMVENEHEGKPIIILMILLYIRKSNVLIGVLYYSSWVTITKIPQTV